LYIAFHENPSDAIVEKCGKRTAVGKARFITEEIPYSPPY
jgi:hypothetical protein